MEDNKNNDLPENYLEVLKKIQEEELRLEGKQANIPFSNFKEQFDKEEESLLDNSEDPVLNKKNFYELIAIISGNIKKGKIRDFVNSEKKLYLKSISKSKDSRFSIKNSLSQLKNIAKEWAQTDKNGFDLGMQFWQLNEDADFHEVENVKTVIGSAFDKKLKGLLSVPPEKKDNTK